MLKVTQLSCCRREQEIFSNLTFNLSPGMILQLQGPNGSGKSSLLKTLAGLLPFHKGVIAWQSKIISSHQTLTGLISEDLNYIADILYIGHKIGLTLALTPKENLIFWKSLKTIPKKLELEKELKLKNELKIEEVLELLGLSAFSDTVCEELSAGQRQKVVLARLWLENAKLWLLDEPFNALDKNMCAILEQRLEQHVSFGGMVILANHATLAIQNSLKNNFKILNLDRIKHSNLSNSVKQFPLKMNDEIAI